MTDFRDLKQKLRGLDWRDKDVMRKARQALRDENCDVVDLGNYTLSEGDTYSRYEICTEPHKFSLILIVWGPKSCNMIHDHHGAKYVLKVLKGSLKDEHYTFDGNRPKGERLNKISDETLGLHSVSENIDFKGYHSVVNTSTTEEAVSLHIYSPPLTTCTVIDSETEEPQVKRIISLANKNYEQHANPLAK